jgi:hypothetical protein
MSAEGKKMGLALVCADGRLHQEAAHYNDQIAQHMGVDLVDVVAVPGPDGLGKLGRDAEEKAVVGWLKLLIDAHHPESIAVIGHYKCAGNPVEDAEHDTDAARMAAQLKAELGFPGPVMGFSTVWHADNEWSLKKLALPEAILSPIQVSTSEA